MTSNTTKYPLNVALFATLGSILVTGLILWWGIPRGFGHGCDVLFWGLSRHDWVDIHLFLAVSCFTLMVVHLWTNLKWIVVTTKRYFQTRWIGALVLIMWSWVVLLVLVWACALILGCSGRLSWQRPVLDVLTGW